MIYFREIPEKFSENTEQIRDPERLRKYRNNRTKQNREVSYENRKNPHLTARTAADTPADVLRHRHGERRRGSQSAGRGGTPQPHGIRQVNKR